jgi:dihydrofolate reductase
MRKVVVITMLSLDGVMQAPSGPEEGASEDFSYGGWQVPYPLGDAMDEQMRVPFDLLLGRKTYEIFAPYWPKQHGWAIADSFNKAKKYVVSDSKIDLSWKETRKIDGDVIAKIKALKEEDGPMFQVHGSCMLVQTLLNNDLVDEVWLKIYPVTIGEGRRLFGEGTTPAAFELIKARALPSGVIMADYKRAGEIKTGSFA